MNSEPNGVIPKRPRFLQRAEGSRAKLRLHSTRDPSLHLKNGYVRDDVMKRKSAGAHLQLTVDEFLVRVEILPWDSEAAKHYADLRNAREGSGSPMGNLDMMIAAHALAVRATLVTHDRVFQRVKRLKIENWTKSD